MDWISGLLTRLRGALACLLVFALVSSCTHWNALGLAPGEGFAAEDTPLEPTSPLPGGERVDDEAAQTEGPEGTGRADRSEPMPHVKPIGDEPWVEEATQPGQILEPSPVLGKHVIGTTVIDDEDLRIGQVTDLVLDPAGRILGCWIRSEDPRLPPFVDREWCRFEPGPSGLVLRIALPNEEPFPSLASFQGQTAGQIEGEVTDVSPAESIAGANIFKLHDDENLVHRFLIEPASLVEARFDEPLVGQRLSIEGFVTRDRKGKLWIARELEQRDTRVRLRDAEMAILWTELAKPFELASKVSDTSVVTSDGATLPVEDVFFDLVAGEVSHLRVRTAFGSYKLGRWYVERDGKNYKASLSLLALEVLVRGKSR